MGVKIGKDEIKLNGRFYHLIVIKTNLIMYTICKVHPYHGLLTIAIGSIHISLVPIFINIITASLGSFIKFLSFI